MGRWLWSRVTSLQHRHLVLKKSDMWLALAIDFLILVLTYLLREMGINQTFLYHSLSHLWRQVKLKTSHRLLYHKLSQALISKDFFIIVYHIFEVKGIVTQFFSIVHHIHEKEQKGFVTDFFTTIYHKMGFISLVNWNWTT